MRRDQFARWRALAFLSCTLALAGAVFGADHQDAPIAKSNPQLDITDVYAFRSPTNPANLVFAVDFMSIFDFVGGAGPGPLFADNASYEIYVDSTGDLVPDTTIRVTFSRGSRDFAVAGLTPLPFTGAVTQLGDLAPLIATNGEIRAFAGPRDDPFFFDLTAFKDFTGPTGPYLPAAGIRRAGAGAPQNFFKGNVASIVIELPATLVNGGLGPNAGTIRVWAKTFRSL